MSFSQPTRRRFLASAGASLAPALAKQTPQRAIVFMCDGFGLEYMEATRMPHLQKWREKGIFRRVQSTFPTVTNTNNASICCGV